MKLKLAYSTCPNDTFIFDAIANQRMDLGNLEFDIELADIKDLNHMAFREEADIIKVSYHAYAYLADKYIVLDSGSALGRENGPILVSKTKIYPDEVGTLKIAIPGKYTTANLLLNIAYPNVNKRVEYLFSDIEEAVLSGEVDAGLLIHEGRFTYSLKGLKKIMDLGEYWFERTQSLIPLGGIIAKRSLGKKTISEMNRLLRYSVDYAVANPEISYDYVKRYAKEMDDEVIFNHIQLYVNDFTIDLGNIGRESIMNMYELAAKANIIEKMPENIFMKK